MNCYRVICKCTNGANNTVNAEDLNRQYLGCDNGVLYVMASSFGEVQTIIGPNIVEIHLIGPCYSKL